MLFSVDQAFVGRDEIRVPLKRLVQEGYKSGWNFINQKIDLQIIYTD